MKRKKKSVNKKVKNATPTEYDGIQFKSKLEAFTYKALKDNKIQVEYEPTKYILLPGFKFNDTVIRPMTYTPDFIGANFIIECKGRPNDVFPYKWKWFKWHMVQNGLDLQYHLFLVHNQKEVKSMIDSLINR